jgi:hypothetical protein
MMERLRLLSRSRYAKMVAISIIAVLVLSVFGLGERNAKDKFVYVPNAIYNIVADYSAPSIGIPYRIIWKGTWQNEVINETSYIFAQ